MKKSVKLITLILINILILNCGGSIEICGQWDIVKTQSNISSTNNSYIHFPVGCDLVREQSKMSPYLSSEIQENSSLTPH